MYRFHYRRSVSDGLLTFSGELWKIFSEVVALFFSLDNFVAIALGVVIGVVVGSIPGLTATMAVALALPFTFSMQPVAAILLLVGIYKGGDVRRLHYGDLD